MDMTGRFNGEAVLRNENNPLDAINERRQQMLMAFIQRDPNFETIKREVMRGANMKEAFMNLGDRRNISAFVQQDYTQEQARQAALQQGYTSAPGQTEQFVRGGRDTGFPSELAGPGGIIRAQ